MGTCALGCGHSGSVAGLHPSECGEQVAERHRCAPGSGPGPDPPWLPSWWWAGGTPRQDKLGRSTGPLRIRGKWSPPDTRCGLRSLSEPEVAAGGGGREPRSERRRPVPGKQQAGAGRLAGGRGPHAESRACAGPQTGGCDHKAVVRVTAHGVCQGPGSQEAAAGLL